MNNRKKQTAVAAMATVLSVTSIASPLAVMAQEDTTIPPAIMQEKQQKKAPDIILPENLQATEGTALKDVVLPDNWAWAENSTLITTETAEYPARFKVDDVTYDYSEVEGYHAQEHYVERMVTVTVKPAKKETAEPAQGKSRMLRGNMPTTYGVGDVEINDTNFPDEAFRTWLRQQTYGADGIITLGEIAGITTINCNANVDIQDLTGIAHFTALTELDCSSTRITSLDVSQNKNLKKLECNNNTNLKSITVSGANALTELYCNNTEITNLDVSLNKALTELDCSITRITNLDVSQNTALTTLACSMTDISSLDVRQNKALKSLDCGLSGIVSLEVDQNTALTDLNCSATGITSLDVSQNTDLKKLECNNTRITSLDVSENKALKSLGCSGTRITSLNVSQHKALTELDCSNTGITNLDVSQHKALTKLYCQNTGIITLDVSLNTALTELYCNNTGITNLDVSLNTALTKVNCSNTGITNLDVSLNKALTELYCNNTGITNLDVSQHKDLKKLECNNNTNLKSITVSGANALTELYCNNTGITNLDVSLNTALKKLACDNTSLAYLKIGTNNNLTTVSKNNLKPVSLEVKEDKGDSFKMADKFADIDISKISNVKGADYDSTTGIMSNYRVGTPVTYTYACGTSGNGAETIDVTMNLTDTRANSTISVTADLSKTYDKNAVNASPAVSRTGSTGTVSYKWEQKKNVTDWEPIASAPTDAGTYRVTAILASDDNYKGATSTPVEFTISKAANNWIDTLSITGWTYGTTANKPTAAAKFGSVVYLYNDSKTGTYTDAVPSNAGTWYVKAVVKDTDSYEGLESDTVSFDIAPKDVTSDTQITVPDITADTDLDNLVIKDEDKVLEKGKDYDVDKKQDGNKVTVTITFKGNYTGTITKTYTVVPSGGDKNNNKSNDNQNTNNKKAVQTGDTSSLGLWSSLLAFSAGTAVFLKRKKQRKETEE